MKKLVALVLVFIVCSCSNENNEPQQNCVDPEAEVTSVTTVGATVSIIGTAASYTIEYGEAGFSQGSGIEQNVDADSYTFSGLDIFTEYDFYLQANCDSDISNWVGPFSFITQCDVDNGVFNGDVILNTQQEVDDFGAMCYSGINGTLRIGGSLGNNIYSLLPLININSVTNPTSSCTPRVIIFGTQLVSLKGLNLILDFDCGLMVEQNDLLINFQDVNLINTLDLLSIRDNDSLESFLGLEELTEINSLIDIRNNNSLESFEGLNNLTNWLFSYFEGNQNLYNFEGLDSLESVGDFWVINTNFENFIGLETLTSINNTSYFYDNSLLQSFDGLENLIESPNVQIYIGAEEVGGFGPPFGPNPMLSDFCGLQNLLNNSTGNVELFIANNAYNPTQQDIIDGNCSQ